MRSALDYHRQHYVYRLFDADDALLYVGVSSDPESRIRHYHAQPWARSGQAGDAFELYRSYDHHTFSAPFSDREDALWAEWSAIYHEQPRFNIQHRDRPPRAP